MKPEKVLQPRYFDAFRCLGSDCEDTCCIGWNVHIDKRTYSKYQNCSDSQLGSSLHTLITINEKAPNDDDYAKIVLNGVACPFLSEGLCSIQVRLGEEYLSNMCATYPRVTNRVGDVLHRSLDLSCPEAARVLLLNPEPIEFDEGEFSDASIRLANVPALDTSGQRESPDRYRFFRVVRRMVISLLQNRSYPLWKRFFMLGCFCVKLDETVTAGGWDHADVLQAYLDNLNNDALSDPMASSRADPTAQLETVLELIVARISSDFNPRRFLECYQEFMNGIQWTSKSTMDEIGGRYAEAYSAHYAPFVSRHEHILEHYLVNYAHRTLFPFGLPESNQRLRNERVSSPILVQYMLMIAYYAITNTVLIGMAGFHKSAFGTEHVIKALQSCTKTFEHSMTFPGRAIEMLAEKAMTTPASLCVLIRN